MPTFSILSRWVYQHHYVMHMLNKKKSDTLEILFKYIGKITSPRGVCREHKCVMLQTLSKNIAINVNYFALTTYIL